MDEELNSDDEYLDLGVSKSQRKREHLAIQQFIKELIALPKKQIQQLPLSEQVREEVLSAQRLSRSALKRQVGFIAKYMEIEEVEVAQTALAKLLEPKRKAVSAFHLQEQWRDQLLDPTNTQRDELINTLVEKQEADRQRLRQLIRSAEKDTEMNKPPKAARQLFQYLKQLPE